MRNAPALIVQTQRFDLIFATKDAARRISDRVSRYASNEMQKVLDDACRPYLSKSYSIPLLELDIELISENALEQEMSEKIRKALTTYLAGKFGFPLSPYSERPDAKSTDEVLSQLSALLQGHISKGESDDIGHLLVTAISTQPRDLMRLLYAIGKKQNVRNRLARMFATEHMYRLLRLLAPEQAALIIDYSLDVLEIHRKKPIVAESRAEFSHVLWEFIFTYILLEEGSYFNTKSLVMHSLRNIAARYRISYAQLLQDLNQCIQIHQISFSQKLSLPKILLDLQSEAQAPATTATLIVSDAQSKLDQLESFLLHGVFSWQQGTTDRATLHNLLQELIEHIPDQLLASLLRLGVNPSVRMRIAQSWGFSVQAALTGLVEPAHARVIVKLVQALAALQIKRPLVQRSHRQLMVDLWEFVWTNLLSDRGSYFNQRSFAKGLLMQMAARYNLDYEQLLSDFFSMASQELASKISPSNAPDSLLNILLSLKKELNHDSDKVLNFATSVSSPSGKNLQSMNDVKSGFALAMRAVLLRQHLLAARSYLELRDQLRLLVQSMAARHHVDARHLLSALVTEPSQVHDLAYLDRDAVSQILLALQDDYIQEHRAKHAQQELQAPVPTAVPDWNRPYQSAAREFVVQSLILDRGSYFNNRSYIKNLLQKIAAKHGLQYHFLLMGLNARNSNAAVYPTRQDELRRILADLDAENKLEVVTQQDWFDFYEFGELRNGTISYAQLKKHHAAFFSNTGNLLLWFRRAQHQPQKIRHLLRYMKQADLLRLLQLLSPDYAGFIHTFLMACEDMSPHRKGAGAGLPWAIVLYSSSDDHSPRVFDMVRQWTAMLARELNLSRRTYCEAMLHVIRQREVLEPRFMPLNEALTQLLSDAAQNEAEAFAQQHVADVDGAGDTAQREILTDQSVDMVDVADAGYTDQDGFTTLPLLQFYLQFGSFPESEVRSKRQVWAAIEAAMDLSPSAFRAMLHAATRHAMERHRMISDVPVAVLDKLMRVLFAADYALVIANIRLWRTVHATLKCQLPALQIEEEVVRHAGLNEGWDVKQFSLTMLSRTYQKYASDKDRKRILPAVLSSLENLDFPENISGRLRAVVQSISHEHVVSSAPEEDRPLAATRAKQVEKEESLPAGESFYVANAGLVLLWQFLPVFFERSGLVRERQFIDFESQCRAVLLSQLLVTGEFDAEEHTLLLNKILCGVAETAPLVSCAAVTEAEQTLGEALLQAVCQHWEKLSNTSIEGLRQTFLMRNGRLQKKDDDWTLLVEKGPFDVLLQSLPWTISTIRLPWMKGNLWVDWK
ncbi:MAG: hypothetical protein KGM99_02915 [Burkholderiales bacterium]|nr:hypothetical protein [Burkholderiales bacterium]